MNEKASTDELGPPDQIDDQSMFKPLDWICKYCSHHQTLGAEKAFPDKCEKCGMSGASASI